MRTRINSECSRQILVTRSRKCLRQDVRKHDGSLTILKLHFTTLDFITDVMALDVNVICTTMVDGILRHLDAGLVVFENLQSRCRLV